MKDVQAVLQAKKDIETIGGISINTGMLLESLGLNPEVIEESIKVMIAKGQI